MDLRLLLEITIGLPLLSAIGLAFIKHLPSAGWVNLGASLLTFITSVGMAWRTLSGDQLDSDWLYIDAFNVYLVVVTTFVGLTTSIFSRPYMQHVCEKGLTTKKSMRLYHSMYQVFLFTMLMALTTNNLGILWVAIEGATLATVLLVSLYRTPEAIEAAWKYFVLCGVGIALALFGTVLIYYAAQDVLAVPEQGMTWSVLNGVSQDLDPTVMSIAFVFLLVGYGTKVGLVPLHNWLPDAHSEGPTPMSAVLSGLLLNIALYAVIRLKILADGSLAGTENPNMAGLLLMFFGLLSFIVGALFLHRQKDIKRMFSYSSVEHMGLMTFAFGLGGPLATFAGLFHMLNHSLVKSSIFVTVGHATHIAGTQSIEQIRGIIRTQPSVGWPLIIGVTAIAGFPPFGIFTGEFLLLSATMEQLPWVTVILLLGLAIAFAGLLKHVHPMVYGTAPAGQYPVKANIWPVYIHLAIVLWLGLSMPGFLAQWLNQATALISGGQLL